MSFPSSSNGGNWWFAATTSERSHWTAEDGAESVLNALTALITLILEGRTPAAVCSLLFGAKLIALMKENGDICPFLWGVPLGNFNIDRRTYAPPPCTQCSYVLNFSILSLFLSYYMSCIHHQFFRHPCWFLGTICYYPLCLRSWTSTSGQTIPAGFRPLFLCGLVVWAYEGPPILHHYLFGLSW